MKTWRWLESTRELQAQAYDLHPDLMEGEELATYLRDNALAAVKELMEFLDNFVWKPWATTNRGEVIDRDAAVEELIDVGHFLANLAVTLGVTDEEWQQIYKRKQALNRARQARTEGYRGVSGS